MAQFQTADGRWLVGDVEGNGEYSGFLGWRDCVIQLTSNGATEQSVKYLEALRDYAFNRNSLGEPIVPPSVNVWVSNNGKTFAVQADDYAVDGNTFTICGIKWTGSAWDYSNAGQGGSGGGGGVLVVTAVTDSETDVTSLNKTWQEIHDAMLAGGAVIFFPDSELVAAIMTVGYFNSQYGVKDSVNKVYATDTSDGYPVGQGGK